MPTYTYQCQDCGEMQDRMFPISDFPDEITCSQCGRKAKKVIVLGHGGIQCDSIADVTWLPSALKTLPDEAVDKVQSRTDHKRYLKEKGYIQAG